MRVLVGCEFSGIVRDAFRRHGHDAWSCDLLPTESVGHHIEGDVLKILDKNWDLMVAHPPCTYLCNSGVRWLYEREGRWERMLKAVDFFVALLSANIPYIAVENPIPHKYAVQRIGRKYDQIVQPWQFGHGETKATCLWLKNLPLLRSTNIVSGRYGRIHKIPPSSNQGKLRSISYWGIADAMAEQWGRAIQRRKRKIRSIFIRSIFEV
ncbi:MAG: hypothetical protein ACTSQE_16585 [Candidatus Heimdallarchaeaceae archaeon]